MGLARMAGWRRPIHRWGWRSQLPEAGNETLQHTFGLQEFSIYIIWLWLWVKHIFPWTSLNLASLLDAVYIIIMQIIYDREYSNIRALANFDPYISYMLFLVLGCPGEVPTPTTMDWPWRRLRKERERGKNQFSPYCKLVVTHMVPLLDHQRCDAPLLKRFSIWSHMSSSFPALWPAKMSLSTLWRLLAGRLTKLKISRCIFWYNYIISGIAKIRTTGPNEIRTPGRKRPWLLEQSVATSPLVARHP